MRACASLGAGTWGSALARPAGSWAQRIPVVGLGSKTRPHSARRTPVWGFDSSLETAVAAPKSSDRDVIHPVRRVRPLLSRYGDLGARACPAWQQLSPVAGTEVGSPCSQVQKPGIRSGDVRDRLLPSPVAGTRLFAMIPPAGPRDDSRRAHHGSRLASQPASPSSVPAGSLVASMSRQERTLLVHRPPIGGAASCLNHI